PCLVVIDELDECNRGELQARVLSIIVNALRNTSGLPLQFLICSQPEPTIKKLFDSKIFHPHLQCYFIHMTPCPGRTLRHFWMVVLTLFIQGQDISILNFQIPLPDVIWSLAYKLSGQFIYPSTILKYVD
ncbi:hypothetical protein L218DRAFT_841132, partial [Marasmius fiardii PR-910]